MKKLVILFPLLICLVQVFCQIPLNKKSNMDLSKVVFSPSSRFCFLAFGNEAIVCNSSGETIAEFKTPDAILAIAFSPDEQFISTAESSGRLTIWDTKGKLIKSQNDSRLWLSHSVIAYSPDGTKLVHGKDDHTAFLLDNKGEFIATLDHSGRDPDAVSIAGGGYDGRSPLQADHTSEITFVKFSLDGNIIFSSGQDSSAILWDKNGKLYAKINNPFGVIKSMDFAKDGKMITGHEDGKVILWDSKGKLIKEVENLKSPVLFVQFFLDGSGFSYGTNEGIITSRKTNGELIHSYDLNPGQLSTFYTVSPNLKLAVYKVNWGGGFVLKNLDQKSIEISAPFTELVLFMQGKDQIVTLGSDRKGIYWDFTGKMIKQTNVAEFFFDEWSSLNKFAISLDGKKIAAYTLRGTGITYNDTLLTEYLLYDTLSGTYENFITFSPDGEYLLTGNENICVLRKTKALYERIALPKPASIVSSVAISPNNQLILLIGYDGTATLMETTGKVLQKIEEKPARFTAGIFSPDSQTIILGNNHGVISKWNINGQQISNFKTNGGGIQTMQYAPSGKAIFTIDVIGGVKKWDFEGNSQRFNVLPPAQKLFLSKDGKYGAIVRPAPQADKVVFFEVIKN
jgi:WD40 repeat protein